MRPGASTDEAWRVEDGRGEMHGAGIPDVSFLPLVLEPRQWSERRLQRSDGEVARAHPAGLEVASPGMNQGRVHHVCKHIAGPLAG